MDGSLILFNILNPPVLFFFLGMAAVFSRSDLEIPQPLPKLFSLYLLIAIGFKGGYELSESGMNGQVATTLIAARKIRDLQKSGTFAIAFSVFVPVVNAIIGIILAKVLGFSQGNALLFAVLCASASYIAVPAAMRMTIPEANPSLYVSMALALTFPFNIIVGIPLYLEIIKQFGIS
jgi:hypothetical protein